MCPYERLKHTVSTLHPTFSVGVSAHTTQIDTRRFTSGRFSASRRTRVLMVSPTGALKWALNGERILLSKPPPPISLSVPSSCTSFPGPCSARYCSSFQLPRSVVFYTALSFHRQSPAVKYASTTSRAHTPCRYPTSGVSPYRPYGVRCFGKITNAIFRFLFAFQRVGKLQP